MEKIIEYLKQLELSELEAKLYVTLLQTGPVSVRDLAASVDVKRTTAYLYIDQLVEKGLVIKLVKGAKKLIAAEDPKALESLVNAQVAKASSAQQEFPKILDSLTANLHKPSDSNEAEFKYYKGKNGVKKIYEDALQADEIKSFVNLSQIEGTFPENFVLFDQALKRNPKIQIFEICEESDSARERVGTSDNNHHYKVLPNDMKLAAQDILIYNGKVGIINLGEDTHGVILKNADLYSNLKILFDFIWKILPG